MQSHLVVLALAGIASAFTPTQVKEDLDAHPWRPSPNAAVVKPPNVVSPETAKPAPPAAAAVPAPTPTTVVTAGSWQLQIAALSSLEAAKAEQKRIEKIVGTGKVEVLSEGAVHRVRYGAYATKEAAEIAREDLRSKGVEGFPVKKN